MSHQIENIYKEIEIIKNNKIEIVELKSTITEIKNSLEYSNSRFEQLGERIRELEARSVEIIQSEEQNKKIMKKNEQSLQDLWDMI